MRRKNKEKQRRTEKRRERGGDGNGSESPINKNKQRATGDRSDTHRWISGFARSPGPGHQANGR